MSAVKMSRPNEDIGTTLNLPKGAHKFTLTLFNAKGEIRDTRSTTVPVDPAIPRTLRVRLSRFKSNLELQIAVGKPETSDAPEPPKTEVAADSKAKPADPKAKPADPKAKPLASTQPVKAPAPAK